MHISEGILSAPVLISGTALSVAGTAIGLKKLDYDRIPQVALLSAGFFVACLVHVPIGPASAHLILNGLWGSQLRHQVRLVMHFITSFSNTDNLI